jgi:hypothetical protein
MPIVFLGFLETLQSILGAIFNDVFAPFCPLSSKRSLNWQVHCCMSLFQASGAASGHPYENARFLCVDLRHFSGVRTYIITTGAPPAAGGRAENRSTA